LSDENFTLVRARCFSVEPVCNKESVLLSLGGVQKVSAPMESYWTANQS